MSERSTFSIIGTRYLDTQFDAVYIEALEKELKQRGVVGLTRASYEYLAASSLWWNIIWWEWIDLDEADIKIGWGQNIVIFGIAAGVVAIKFGLLGALVAFLSLHLLTTTLGFWLRSGTKENN